MPIYQHRCGRLETSQADNQIDPTSAGATSNEWTHTQSRFPNIFKHTVASVKETETEAENILAEMISAVPSGAYHLVIY